jgi:hypothetical protein
MRCLREDLHEPLSGNGHCTRPAELDCHFESICETCTFFSTNSEFAPTRQRQLDHATERDQLDRVDLFTLLLDRINQQEIAAGPYRVSHAASCLLSGLAPPPRRVGHRRGVRHARHRSAHRL